MKHIAIRMMKKCGGLEDKGDWSGGALIRRLNLLNLKILWQLRQRGSEWRSSNQEAESAKLENSLTVATTPSNIPHHCFYFLAQPISKPVWNGSLILNDENYGTMGALVAHLSTMACFRVFEAAKQLPELLCLELLPRSNVWPASFHQWGPSEINIGLYLFPNNQWVTDEVLSVGSF